jgi:hypothetical protein
MTVFREHGGHCTRCRGPIGDTAHMVRERVAHTIIGDFAVHTDKWTPVCEPCAKPKEMFYATISRICIGCGQKMLVAPSCVTRVCSSRCYQRNLRARHRAEALNSCLTCGSNFAPKWKDALYCSGACKQSAFRRRLSKEAWIERFEGRP